ncbi:MAG: FMN-binding negative transcriptional regulator [Henriciella sp.]|uniref:FMN-binding negative transcriptional regulator n=1 Tax=Henriciella sp. TaxID=1968823 RepID=UPI003C79398C
MADLHADVSRAQMLDFAAAYPLAWIVPYADPSAALLMPVLIETNEAGAPQSLLGHLPRTHDATTCLAEDGRTAVLFLGPNAYIPPGWIRKKDWAPTWNFVSLKVTATAKTDTELTRHAVETLVDHMEGDRWSVAEMGARYQGLLRGIIGFRAAIETLTPRFKTGRDETAESYADLRQGLAGHPLIDWME